MNWQKMLAVILHSAFSGTGRLLGRSLFYAVLITHSGAQAGAASVDNIRQKLNKTLDQVEHDLNELEESAKRLRSKSSEEWQKMLADLKKHRDELRAEIKSLKESSKDKVDAWQGKLESAMAELKAGVKRASEELKK